MAEFSFDRVDLAKSIADGFFGNGLDDHMSGLFIAAPRRTGKTHFIQNDLLPEMGKRGALTIYIDLWADMQTDPAKLIADSIKTKLREHLPKAIGFARKIGLAKFGVGQIAFDIEKVGMPDGHTLKDALDRLASLSEKTVFLAIDEAQRSLETEAGIATMFALKSARDTMNVSGKRALMLAFTGSQRDKLAKLLDTKQKPFYGSKVTRFPSLDRRFTDAFTVHINRKLDSASHLSPDSVWEAFAILEYRPQMLRNTVAEVFMSIGPQPASEALIEAAKQTRQRQDEEANARFLSRSDVERAILKKLSEVGMNFTPFSQESLSFYSEYAGKTVDVPEVQRCLESLRQDSILWKETRGTYAFEDEAWMRIVSNEEKAADVASLRPKY